MVNHVRTLLFNLPGAGSGYVDEPGEEFVPPNFIPPPLPTYLQQLHQVLFYRNPDRLTRNYLLRKYMAVLHRTELEAFVKQLDPRITYDILPEDSLFDSAFRFRVRNLTQGTENPQAIVNLDEAAPGYNQFIWELEVLAGNVAAIRRRAPAPFETEKSFTVSSGLSSIIELPGLAAGIRIQPAVGDRWYITANTRPQMDVGTVVSQLQQIGTTALLQLFRVGKSEGNEEPWKSFKAIWDRHPEAPYRLGSVLLAWAYAADELLRVPA